MISKLPFTVNVHLFGLTVVAHRWQHRAVHVGRVQGAVVMHLM